MKQIRAILNRTNRRQRPLNVLCFPTHERYESNLAKTGHNFYSFYHPQVKTWNDTYAPAPDNYRLCKTKSEQMFVLHNVDFDVILSQNKYGQLQLAQKISQEHSVPICSIEHTLPHPSWPAEQIDQMKQLKGHSNCFISEYSRKEWGWENEPAKVIHHGIDTKVFSPQNLTRKNACLSVVNEWKTRDVWCGYSFWEKATKDLPVHVVGDNPGWTTPAASVQELASQYASHRIFVNTSLVSPIPTSLLEAMACGCICVSTKNCMIPEIIKDGHNGFLCDNPEEMKEVLNTILNAPNEYEYLGHNAVATIGELFGVKRFIQQWDMALRETADIEV
jgi:hypothetical protein